MGIVKLIKKDIEHIKKDFKSDMQRAKRVDSAYAAMKAQDSAKKADDEAYKKRVEKREDQVKFRKEMAKDFPGDFKKGSFSGSKYFHK